MAGVVLDPNVPAVDPGNRTSLSLGSDGKLQISVGGAAPVDVGGGISTVHTDPTLIGDGSVSTPLGVNPVAARAPDWFGALKALFQQQTGMSPLAWSAMIEKDFADSGLTASQQGFQTNGGSFSYQNLPGGVIKATNGTGAGNYADWASAPQGQSPYSILGNLRAKRFMAAYRIAIGKAPSATSAISAGVFDGGTYTGLGYSGAQTNWQYSRGSAPANNADTGKAITVDASGATGYLTMFVANFDLVHVAYCVDVLGGAPIVNAELLTAIPSIGGYPYLYNEGTAGDIYFLDKVLICAEL